MTINSPFISMAEGHKMSAQGNQFEDLNAAFSGAIPLDPLKIPKYANQLVIPPVYEPKIVTDPLTGEVLKHAYEVDMTEFKQQILPPGFPMTTVWGYGGKVKDPATGKVKYFRNSPGATFEAVRGIPVEVKWVNKLYGSEMFAVDPTLHWANPNKMSMDPSKPWPKFPPGFSRAQRPIATVTHLHGGEVPSVYDGHPDAWFTANGKKGSAYRTNLYKYPNEQQAATLWYHDHALGITRINVYSGLAGFYLLRDNGDYLQRKLPEGKYEIPLVVQDRTFKPDGSLLFSNNGINPDIHPYWQPEFFGNTIMVNGKVWPNLNVERRQYRFRLLNGSNARFYNFKFDSGMSFIQIGSDGGYLPKPVTLKSLLLAPGERADILVDFSGLNPGTSVLLKNDAATPYPDGDSPDPETTGQIMKFLVPAKAEPPVTPAKLPDTLNVMPNLTPDSPVRNLTLYEVEGTNGPLEVLLNGQKWEAAVSELPKVGSTEEWDIINLTNDTHPIHLHLVQFQVLNRQDFNADKYEGDWVKLNGPPPIEHKVHELPPKDYLTGSTINPDPNETGWKDTVRVNPGQVTRIKVRFAPQNATVCAAKPGINLFKFDPTLGPGYVWHCHILDHEDNEMMRPYKVVK